MVTFSVSEAMGFIVFGLGAVLILLGIMIIVLQEIFDACKRG